jgi:CheY-like chemotaxis protein
VATPPYAALVIDDVAAVRHLVSDVLRAAGHTVETATTAAEGLERVAAGGIDLVLLDRLLPDQEGVEVCRWLRAQERSDDLPIIMLTGLGDEDARHEGFAAGADDTGGLTQARATRAPEPPRPPPLRVGGIRADGPLERVYPLRRVRHLLARGGQ